MVFACMWCSAARAYYCWPLFVSTNLLDITRLLLDVVGVFIVLIFSFLSRRFSPGPDTLHQ